MNLKFLVMGVLLLVGIVAISGCTQNQENTTGFTAPNTVTIENFAFNPQEMTVKVGTTVTWVNRETDHDVVSDTGVFTSPVLANGENFTHTFTEAGEYPYHCGLHPSMTGKIIVEN